VPPALVSAERLDQVATVASALPPVHLAGFECRLAGDDGQVDLQQGIFWRDHERKILAHFLRSDQAVGLGWDGARRLLERSCVPGTGVQDGVAEVWLEMDVLTDRVLGSGTPGLTEPSVIALFHGPRATSPATPEVRRAVLDALLGTAGTTTFPAALDRCSGALPSPAWVSHLGVMLGRDPLGVRVNISDLPLRHFVSYLRDVGWPGDAAQLYVWARELLAIGENVVLCLDILDDLLPRAGLECFFGNSVPLDRRWEPMLERLVALDLCTPEKAKGLLGWPGRITPPEAAHYWPDDLVAQSLGRPAGQFGVIDRLLSHVKLTWHESRPVAAKAYFGYKHSWLGPAQPRDGLATPSVSAGDGSDRRVAPLGRTPATLTAVVDRAVDYLLAARNQGGWWRDFSGRDAHGFGDESARGASSDEWVTAYIAAVLATVPRPAARAAAEQAMELLVTRRADGPGWGYDLLVPPDADTTTWVLRLAQAIGSNASTRLAAGRRFIAGLVGPSGGLATYGPATPGRHWNYAGEERVLDGWYAPHTCVTAAAAVLDLDEQPRLLGYLRRAQRQDGSWGGYWWDDDEYTTARASEALAGHSGHGTAVAAATAWAAERFVGAGAVWSAAHAGESAFATALALQTVLAEPARIDARAQVIARATWWLAGAQSSDGSWPPSAHLRIPDPLAVDPLASPATTTNYIDDRGLFTTATALSALSSVASLGPALL
jgi:hypothetical protein